MRLLDAKPGGGFSLTKFVGDAIPSYAILSHTWEADDQEVTLKDIENSLGNAKNGYRKIEFCAEQATKDGLRYFWVDSCCIDKSNSTELQEAINSMFRWYCNAAKCYVYLSDVSIGQQSWSLEPPWEAEFKQSRWFTRGWTLQELLAPRIVEFFSKESKQLGDKNSLEKQIQEATGIDIRALQGNLSQFSHDERNLWAAHRKTTIEEDQVYCMLGIHGVFLPLIYGEGRQHAFRRLEDEIKWRSKSKMQAQGRLSCLFPGQLSNLPSGME